MYLEGSDQHRGWFQSSLVAFAGGQRRRAVPHRAHPRVHGGCRPREDLQEQAGPGRLRKAADSRGLRRKWGADVVRLWVASQDFRNDIVVSEKRIDKVAETYRVLRNALRYQLSNLYDFDPGEARGSGRGPDRAWTAGSSMNFRAWNAMWLRPTTTTSFMWFINGSANSSRWSFRPFITTW